MLSGINMILHINPRRELLTVMFQPAPTLVLMHRLVPYKHTRSGPLHYTTAYLLLYIAWLWKTNINENIQSPVGCETETKYSAALFVSLC